jgi:hypothetical protein
MKNIAQKYSEKTLQNRNENKGKTNKMKVKKQKIIQITGNTNG